MIAEGSNNKPPSYSITSTTRGVEVPLDLADLERGHKVADGVWYPIEPVASAEIRELVQSAGVNLGEAYFRTPRNTVTAFVNLLAVLEQNPGVEWSDLIEELAVAEDFGDDMTDVDENVGTVPASDELASFRL